MPQTMENSLPHFWKIKCLFLWKSTCRLQYSREIADVWNRYYDTAEKYAKKEVVGIKNQLTTNALNFG